jgi:small multidrug resistance pump
MAWLYLALAIAFEISGTTCVKLSDGFARLLPSLFILPAYAVSLAFLTVAVRTIPIGVAYAIWSGAGTAIIAGIGFLVFREPLTAIKLLFIAVIVVGVVGLHISDRLANGS